MDTNAVETTRNSLKTNGITDKIIMSVMCGTKKIFSVGNAIGIYRWNTLVSIYRQNYRRNIQNLKKNPFADVEVFASDLKVNESVSDFIGKS